MEQAFTITDGSTVSTPFTPRIWRTAHGRTLELGPRARIMGILNVTPDSFSDGGRYQTTESAVRHAETMAGEGAAIIDIGGESTRPGADPVSADEEQARILPVIHQLSRLSDCLISVDTWRAQTARLAIEAGAHIVNDVYGLQRDTDMARTVAEMGAGLVAMHTGRGRDKDADPLADQFGFLRQTLHLADQAGIDRSAIVLDPGFGFAKTPRENIALIARFEELQALQLPLLAGTSRKRFLGHITGKSAGERDAATIACHCLLRQAGAAIFRVHDVASHADALAVCDAVRQPELFDLDGDA